MDKSPAIFVDRDDTLMADVKYCDDPNKVQLLPGVAEGLRLLIDAGYRIIVVTNQSGIGRGYFDAETLQKIHSRLRDELRKSGADYHAVYYCPHTPEDNCECRKPKPGLILKAAIELDIDLASSYTLGDRDLDMEAGKAAGTRTILISNNSVHPDSESLDYQAPRADTLLEAAKLVLSDAKGRGARRGQSIRYHS